MRPLFFPTGVDHYAALSPAATTIGSKVLAVAMGDSHACHLLADNNIQYVRLPCILHVVELRWSTTSTTINLSWSVPPAPIHFDRCSGTGIKGQLGDGNTNSRGKLVTVDKGSITSGSFMQLACGGTHCCVLTTGGKVHCWGLGPVGEFSSLCCCSLPPCRLYHCF